jgi:hypothetical protein
MFYVGSDHQIRDDGYGMQTAPAYALDERGERLELPLEDSVALTKKWRAEFSRLPLGDAVAAMTKAVGIAPCSPCQARQAAMNRMGERIAEWWIR